MTHILLTQFTCIADLGGEAEWDRKWRCDTLISEADTPLSSAEMSERWGRCAVTTVTRRPSVQSDKVTRGELEESRETDTQSRYRCIWTWNVEMELRQMVAEREQHELKEVFSYCSFRGSESHTHTELIDEAQSHTQDIWRACSVRRTRGVHGMVCSFHTLEVTQQE